ncbi:MAG: energy transducer TonB, partial [Flavobacteriales bacterium]
MRSSIIIFSLLFGLPFHGPAYCQSSVDALGGASDAAQGVFDRISGNGKTQTNKDTVYAEGHVQVQPRFPGGMEAMNAYLQANVHYPEKELDADIQGKVIVEFVVRKDGAVVSVTAAGGSGNQDLDAEAIRAVMAMPSWYPGSLDGKTVNVRFTIPIAFTFPEPAPPSKE